MINGYQGRMLEIDLSRGTCEPLPLDPRVAELPDNMFRVLGRMGRDDLVTQLRVQLGG